ncbi:hypothetical protein C0581_04895 [Candidatus Parcubacteria bacterium]|nr:MAG: hypothetical protein C0581_04895 [Candidatus Parcubacteria bacterium]
MIALFATTFFILIATIKPFKIYKKININMATGSLLAVAFLLAGGFVDGELIKQGIIGNEFIRPWEIIVIFFNVAYVSVSTDVTGVFDYLAYKIVHLAKGNGLRLFLFFYIFAGLLSIFTSNDIVILTLTPIIFYLGKHAKINVIPLLFAEFFAANTLSMFLYIDNPTNIMVVNSLGIGFLEYARVMWFPTLVAAVVNFILLRIVFRTSITKVYKIKKLTDFHVRNWIDAFLSLTLMLIMFVSLVLSDTLQIPIWHITLFFAGVFIVEDVCFSFYYWKRGRGISLAQRDKRKVILNIPDEKNEFWMAVKRIPWSILPFVLGFFVIVQAFGDIGFVGIVAQFISSHVSSLVTSIGLTGVVSFFMANVINNQPMTIFFTHVFVNESFVMTTQQLKGSVYALVIASNVGANFTIVGALAGLMWKRILDVKGLKISYIDFFKKGLIITPFVFISALAALYVVLM